MPQSATTADFCLKIEFEKSSENPSRVFLAMSELIDSMNYLDSQLIGTIDAELEPVILLEDVTSGSILAWLAQGLRQIPDESAYNLEWKPLIGQYLVKAKWACINFLENTTEISDSQQFVPLANEIRQIAEETNVKRLPNYRTPTVKGLLESTSKISTALGRLSQNDSAEFIATDPQLKPTPFNMKLLLAPENIDALLTANVIETRQEMILKIKSPDYLGEAQWDFRHGRTTISAKMLDTEWLNQFQNKEVSAGPGDSILATVNVITAYGFDDELVSTSFQILKVKEVKQAPITVQKKIDMDA